MYNSSLPVTGQATAQRPYPGPLRQTASQQKSEPAPYAKTPLGEYGLEQMEAGEPRNAGHSKPQPPMPEANSLCRMGFGYLFERPDIPAEAVIAAMLGQDGIVRYSQELAMGYSRRLAVVLFRCAQIVYAVRNDHQHGFRFDGKVVIRQDQIHCDADLTGEEVTNVMTDLTNLGVFLRLTVESNGGIIDNTLFVFDEEQKLFPEYGMAKM